VVSSHLSEEDRLRASKIKTTEINFRNFIQVNDKEEYVQLM
jgi:hypothetical protein